jgi:hypothetical protein
MVLESLSGEMHKTPEAQKKLNKYMTIELCHFSISFVTRAPV